MNPDNVLRKGTGALCESLLMVEASKAQLVYPDKINRKGIELSQIDPNELTNKLLEERIKEVYCGCNCIEHDIEELNIKDVGKHVIIKQVDKNLQRALISETYAGGRVEAINSGVYRADVEYNFGTHPDSAEGYV